MMSEIEKSHLGYVLHPARRDTEPGYSRIDIWLSDQASGLHFDPRHLHLLTARESDILSWATIDHPYAGLRKLRICAGLVDVAGFGDKHLEMFTFGGKLEVKPYEESTLAVLSSEAPILVRVSSHAAASFLMEEVELLLALRRGAWDEQPGEFDRRLLAAQPLELYHAFLEAVLARSKNLPGLLSEGDQHTLSLLQHEIERIQEHTSTKLRSLEEIL